MFDIILFVRTVNQVIWYTSEKIKVDSVVDRDRCCYSKFYACLRSQIYFYRLQQKGGGTMFGCLLFLFLSLTFQVMVTVSILNLSLPVHQIA